MQHHLNADSQAHVRHGRFFRCRSQPVLAVLDCSAPSHTLNPPLSRNVRSHRLALRVGDLDEAVAYLRGTEARVLGEPTRNRGRQPGAKPSQVADPARGAPGDCVPGFMSSWTRLVLPTWTPVCQRAC